MVHGMSLAERVLDVAMIPFPLCGTIAMGVSLYEQVIIPDR
jgi:hypothetical protein